MLNFDAISEGKHRRLLEAVATRVWARDDVKAMWVVGSLARGNADEHSDVGLLARVGRALAKKYVFDYPEELEELVRRCWRDFRSEMTLR